MLIHFQLLTFLEVCISEIGKLLSTTFYRLLIVILLTIVSNYCCSLVTEFHVSLLFIQHFLSAAIIPGFSPLLMT